MFTGDRAQMGRFVNGPWLRAAAWASAVLIGVLGLYGVWLVVTGNG